MAATQLEVIIGGRWLGLDCLYGDVEMSTCWPGGSDELSWALGTQSFFRFEGGETVLGVYGGAPVWAGSLLEPDPSQDRMTAQGAWHEGDGFMALTAGGAATAVPDTAVTQAIVRGLRWTRPASISAAAASNSTTVDGPGSVNEVLDMHSENNNVRWGVDPFRVVSAKADDTVPTYQTLPLEGGNGFALDNYASTLIGRYINNGTGLFTTSAPVTDAVAEALHGHVEFPVDLTGRGPISAGAVTTMLTSLLALGRAIPQWTAPLELSYGEIFTMGGTPVALELVAAGDLLRVNGGFELAQRLNGVMYVDVPIGRTSLSDGILTIQPLQLATRNLTDILTAALNKKK